VRKVILNQQRDSIEYKYPVNLCWIYNSESHVIRVRSNIPEVIYCSHSYIVSVERSVEEISVL